MKTPAEDIMALLYARISLDELDSDLRTQVEVLVGEVTRRGSATGDRTTLCTNNTESLSWSRGRSAADTTR